MLKSWIFQNEIIIYIISNTFKKIVMYLHKILAFNDYKNKNNNAILLVDSYQNVRWRVVKRFLQ